MNPSSNDYFQVHEKIYRLKMCRKHATFNTFWLTGSMCIANPLMHVFIVSKTCILRRHQRVYSPCVNSQKGPFLKHLGRYLFNVAFWKVHNFWTLVWKMNNSVLKDNFSHDNVLSMSQCGECVMCPQKNVTCKIFELLKWLILVGKTLEINNTSNVFRTLSFVHFLRC